MTTMSEHNKGPAKVARLVCKDRQRVINDLKKQMDATQQRARDLADEYYSELPSAVWAFLQEL